MKVLNNYSFLIADDHIMIRQGIAFLIKELFLGSKILQAANFKEIFKELKENKFDLLILDINFPEGNSLNIISEVKNTQPDIKILIFSAFDEDIYALRYLNAGASGYLNKGSSEEDMKNAIQSMVLSGKYLTQNVKDKILDSFISKAPINPLQQLSNREVEVARLLIKGFGNLEISNLLQIKNTTVSTFKNRIFEKLQIDNLPSLIELFHLYSDDFIT